ncbi:hypothetical protein PV396_26045 [Streptomyces sp. ME02-8801-2C]|uniref:hypothetical protein n=1 Tax=Streptomyces sp. ME02-8801-2C TaxID=3028680 RepID=UPI0029A7EA70|nr:hypothetical protein [Streptomyces sp. ME02-8801-2C]MDX3455358.1 hypothetical protein [Streptomyces sp. ME02-8801-2C]
MTTEPTTSFEPGALLHDPETDRVGEYQATVGPYALLRPVGGGREWQAAPTSLRVATPEQRLSAGVRAANERAGRATWGYAELDRPPVPVADCETCAEVAALRRAAQAASDASAETDADVLMRRHHRAAHGA